MKKHGVELNESQVYLLKFALGQFVKEQAEYVKSSKCENKAGAKRRLDEAKELVEFLN